MDTKCKYNKGRFVSVGITDGFSYSPGQFNIILLKKGYLSLKCGNNRLIANGPSLISLYGTEEVTLGALKGSVASFNFAPQFINIHLSSRLLSSEDYLSIAAEHLFPSFRIFTHHSDAYGGVLPLGETSSQRMNVLFDRISVLTSKQPTFKWSCKVRSEIFLILDLAEFNLSTFESGGNELSDMLESIHAKIDTNLSLLSLFKTYNTTAPTVSRKFKKLFGTTAINYVLNLRLTLCSCVLAFTDINVNEIAESYEFNDSTYFARMFKRQFGLAPLDFRIKKRSDRDNNLK
ncbi:MAG TPA: hypothetical protein DD733_06710 [Clostridiales bacterium]|nr:AraC family transcriptional regulator [Eubacteriales bacterium]HBR31759.1 hypothetical protein [Clostridiales bacterium]